MGRPPARGARYINLDVDYSDDPKITELRAVLGDKGELAFIRLLCAIYKANGYYLAWNERELKCFAGKYRYTAGFVRELVQECIKCDLFDKYVFDAFQVLTSHGIQRRHLQMVRNYGTIFLEEGLLLVDLNDSEIVPAGVRGKICLKNYFLQENPRFLQENPRYTAQNPANEMKGNEKKLYEREDKPPARFAAPTRSEVRAYCQQRQNGINPDRFFDYYEANGWKVGRNPMKDWKAAVRAWEKNGIDRAAEQQAPSYDLDGIMRSAMDFDPTKTKRGEV